MSCTTALESMMIRLLAAAATLAMVVGLITTLTIG